jgi:hypothetical protein
MADNKGHRRVSTANRKAGLTVRHYASTLAGTMWKSGRIAQFSQVSPVLIKSENKELKIYAIQFISCRPSHNI